MSPPVQPSADFSDYASLANRIAQHLKANPNDTQARDDLRYVQARMADSGEAANTEDWADAGGKPSAHPGYDVAAGLTETGIDIPKGIANLFLHPIQTAGQVTGLGNVEKALDTFRDPEADWAEKADAFIRATPLNAGYGPERAALEATGAKSDTPASLEEQTHRLGNVASLGLLGLGAPARGPGTLAALREGDVAGALKLAPRTPEAPSLGGLGARMMGRVVGKIPYVGPLTRAIGEHLADIKARYGKPAVPTEDPQLTIQREMDEYAKTQPEPPGLPPEASPDIRQAIADHAAGTISNEDLGVAIAQAEGRPLPPETPSRVAPTVPTEGPGTQQPLPGSPKGMTAVGPPTPPDPSLGPQPKIGQPAIPGRPDLGTTVPAGPTQTAGPPTRVSSVPVPPDPKMTAVMGPEAQELFQGKGFSGVSRAMNSPAYQNAGVLASRALQQAYPPFNAPGMTLADATATLQRMILEHVQRGREIPPIVSLPKFLSGLQP